MCRMVAPCAPSSGTHCEGSAHARSPGCPTRLALLPQPPLGLGPPLGPRPPAPSQPCPSPPSPRLVSRPVPGSGMNKSAALCNRGCRFSPDGCLRPAAAPALDAHLPAPRGSPGTGAAGHVAQALCPRRPAARRAVSRGGGAADAGSAEDPQLRSPSPRPAGIRWDERSPSAAGKPHRWAGKEVRSAGRFWQPPRRDRGSIWCLPRGGLAAAPDKSAGKPEQVGRIHVG